VNREEKDEEKEEEEEAFLNVSSPM